MYSEESDIAQVTNLYPRNRHSDTAPEIPEPYRTDYREAVLVVEDSPKASAALSRRIPQTILHQEFSINKPTLDQEIQEFIVLPNVPKYLSRAVDAVRVVGNLAAHPMKDQNTGTIVDVEPGEAEWLLDVLDALFDFVFTAPAKLDARRAQLNAKLNRLGKPPLK